MKVMGPYETKHRLGPYNVGCPLGGKGCSIVEPGCIKSVLSDKPKLHAKNEYKLLWPRDVSPPWPLDYDTINL